MIKVDHLDPSNVVASISSVLDLIANHLLYLKVVPNEAYSPKG